MPVDQEMTGRMPVPQYHGLESSLIVSGVKSTSPELRIGLISHGLICELGLNSDSYHIGFKI
jgi:hypothetical protein